MISNQEKTRKKEKVTRTEPEKDLNEADKKQTQHVVENLTGHQKQRSSWGDNTCFIRQRMDLRKS